MHMNQSWKNVENCRANDPVNADHGLRNWHILKVLQEGGDIRKASEARTLRHKKVGLAIRERDVRWFCQCSPADDIK